MAKITWDAVAARYRNEDGTFVSTKAVINQAERRIDSSSVRLENYINAVAAGQGNIDDFQNAILQEIKNQHIQAMMLGGGGKTSMTPSDYGKIGAVLKKEYRFLRDFIQETAAGELSESQIRNRLKMYGNNAWKSFQIGELSAKKSANFTHKRRVLDPAAEHCSDCRDYAAMDWVPIDSSELPPPGVASACKSRCRCTFEYKAEGGQQDGINGVSDAPPEVSQPEIEYASHPLSRSELESIINEAGLYSNDVFDVIETYTGDNYSRIRYAQRGEDAFREGIAQGRLDEDPDRVEYRIAIFKSWANSIEDGLDVLPKFEGTVVRGISNGAFLEEGEIDPSTESVINYFKKENIEAGLIYAEGALSSWSYNTEDNPYLDTPVVFRVKDNRSGVAIEALSKYEDEKEVLLPSGARYRIIEVEQRQNLREDDPLFVGYSDLRYVVELEEITDEEL